MVEWDAQIDRLRDKAENATAEAKVADFKAVTALQLKWDQAAEELQAIAMANEDGREDMRVAEEQIRGEVKGPLSGIIKRTG